MSHCEAFCSGESFINVRPFCEYMCAVKGSRKRNEGIKGDKARMGQGPDLGPICIATSVDAVERKYRAIVLVFTLTSVSGLIREKRLASTLTSISGLRRKKWARFGRTSLTRRSRAQ